MSKKLIGISIGGYQAKYGDVRALEIAKEIGADAVDFSLDLPICDYRREGEIYSKSEEEIVAYYREIGERARALGLIISQTHGKLSGLHGDKEFDDALMKNMKIDVLATAALGAPVCVVHTASSIFHGPDADPEMMQRLNYEMFTGLLPYAKEKGVKVATETFGDARCSKFCCLDYFGGFDAFMEGYTRVKNSEWGDVFTVCIDTGHCNKAMRFGQPTPPDFIRRFGSDISVLHLHDNDTMTDQHKPPLTGSINWNDLLDALDEVGYNGVYNMEIALRCFGEEMMIETGAFAIKIFRNLLDKREKAKNG